MNMPWLPKHPDLSKALQTAKQKQGGEGLSLLADLVRYDLNFLETLQADKALQEKTASIAEPGLPVIRLALLGSSTVEQLLPGIRIGSLRHRLIVQTYAADYGQALQELSNDRSRLHQFGPNAILFASDAFHLFGTQPPGMTAVEAETRLEAVHQQLLTLWRLARQKFKGPILQQTPLPLYEPLMGNNEQRLPDSPAALLQTFQQRLRTWADENSIDLLDIAGRAAVDGLNQWHDPVLWHKAKQEISPAAAPLYGEWLARLLAAQRGLSAKCLVLDLDNTLWGGVIGDEGLEGIRLGQGSALGESYVAFQRYARDLSRRGVILAVCSKNDEANGLEPFDKHPEMVLKKTDIACFAINWNDKASNLKKIAEELNVGLDALVFVDDNPFEREQVRQALPMVRVPEMPEDPALFIHTLASAGYFESVRLTSDDLARTEQYRQNQQRVQAQASFADLSEYLKSLNMELVWGTFDPVNLPRVVQLLHKTNQFNLTTRRHTEEEVKRIVSDPKAVTLWCRLTDRFGDNGIIGVLIALDRGQGDWEIDSWLMSCRVLGRGVEQAMLGLLEEQVARKGGQRLIGIYRPTAKNGMVKEHYLRLGFENLKAVSEGENRWARTLGQKPPDGHFIRVKKGE